MVKYARFFDVTTDELLGVAKKQRSTPVFKSQRALRCLKKIDELSKRDQEALIRTIDNFLKAPVTRPNKRRKRNPRRIETNEVGRCI